MKKKIIHVIGALCIGAFSYGQVGINTTSPEATLDIRAINHLGSVTGTDGVLVPRVSDLTASGTINGQLVYLIADSGSKTKGFYYWDGSSWVGIGAGGGTAGDATNDAWINDGTNSMVKLGTLSNGSGVRTAGTEYVITDTGNTGIGTASPNSSASLHLGATNKGVLINQVNLTSRTDIVTVPNPVAGMLVYNTNANALAGKGYYFWSGTSWSKITSESDGSNFGIGEERGYTYIVSSGIQGGTGVGSGVSKPTINQMTGRTSFGTKNDANILSQWLGVFGNSQTLADLPIFEGLRIDPLFNGNSFKPRFFNTSASDIKVSYSALSTYDNGINNANMVIKPSYYSSNLDGNDDMACSENNQEFDLLEILFSNGRYYRITFTAYRTDDQPATATTCSDASCSNVTRKTIIGVVVRRVQ